MNPFEVIIGYKPRAPIDLIPMLTTTGFLSLHLHLYIISIHCHGSKDQICGPDCLSPKPIRIGLDRRIGDPLVDRSV